MQSRVNQIPIFFLLLTLLSACGYQLQGSGSVLPENIKNVYIADVVNNTTESGLSRSFRDALEERFERYGVLTVVDEPYQADAVLKATILRLNRDTRSVTPDTDTALQEETTVSISAELIESNGSPLWSNPNMFISDSFSNDSSTVITTSTGFAESGLNAADLAALNNRELGRGQESQILDGIFETAARRIYNSAVLPEF